MTAKHLLASLLSLLLLFSLFACTSTPEETIGKTEATSAKEEITTLSKTEETTKEKITESTEETTVKVTETSVEETEKTETDSETAITTTSNEITETDTSSAEETESETIADAESNSEPEIKNEESTRLNYFEADLEEYVSLKSGALESIEIELSNEFIIDENDVREYIDELRLEFSTPLNNWATVNDQPVKFGDIAYLYYKCTVDGTELALASHWTDVGYPASATVGSSNKFFVPELLTALIGIVPSATSEAQPLTVELTLPENFYEESYRGKTAKFTVWLVHTVQCELPEYNEEFILNELRFEPDANCKDVIAAFEADILAELKFESSYWEELEKETLLWEYVMSSTTIIKLPESEIEYYYNTLVSTYKEYYEYMGAGYESFDAFMAEFIGVEDGDDWHITLNENYVYPMVEQHLMIHAVANALSVTVTEEDRLAFLEHYSEEHLMTPNEIVAQMGEYMVMEEALYYKLNNIMLEKANFSYAK